MITITEQAILRIKEMIREQENNLNTLRFGVTGGGFAINNPNAIASCGCGSSFRTKTNQGTPENC